MRFYQLWNGFIWEFDSIKDWLLALIGRLLGLIIGLGILYYIMMFFTQFDKGI